MEAVVVLELGCPCRIDPDIISGDLQAGEQLRAISYDKQKLACLTGGRKVNSVHKAELRQPASRSSSKVFAQKLKLNF